jgi:hypothetical protein
MLTETGARYDIPTYKQGKFIIAKEFEGVSKERCAEPRLADCFLRAAPMRCVTQQVQGTGGGAGLASHD